MELKQSRTIAVPRERVWLALNDPDVLKASIPGCESFERVGDDAYRATVAAKVGPVSARFTGQLTLLDIDAPNGYRIKFDGQGGGAGFASGEAKVALEDAPDAQTLLSYDVKAQVGGKLAQIGNRLVDGAAKKLADDFFARFAGELTKVPEAQVVVAAPTQTPMVAGGRGRWVRVLAIGVIVAILIYLFARGAG